MPETQDSIEQQQREPQRGTDSAHRSQQGRQEPGGAGNGDGGNGDGGASPRTRRGRRLAEWVSLGVSVIVLVSAAGYLVYEGLQKTENALPVTATVQADRAELRGGRHVVPIEVKNNGPQTARDLKLKIAHKSKDGRWQEQDFLIDYLAEHSSQTIYVYLDRPPGEAELLAEPQQYRLH